MGAELARVKAELTGRNPIRGGRPTTAPTRSYPCEESCRR
jgi:hypothetical protein